MVPWEGRWLDTYVHLKAIATKKINVNVDIKLDNARMTISPVHGGDVLTVNYALTVNYSNPNAGHIRFTGRLHYTGPDAVDASTKWDDKDAAPQAKLEMTNGVLSQMAPMMLMLAHQMSLPSPVQIPVIGQMPPKGKQPGGSPYHG